MFILNVLIVLIGRLSNRTKLKAHFGYVNKQAGEVTAEDAAAEAGLAGA